MRYVLARYNREQREEAYRIYISDGLRFISENSTRSAFESGGKYLNLRYYDLIYPSAPDERTADDIINHVKQGLGRLGGE